MGYTLPDFFDDLDLIGLSEEEKERRKREKERLNNSGFETPETFISDVNAIAENTLEKSLRRISQQRVGHPEPKGFLGKGVDLLSRGNYAAAGSINTMMEESPTFRNLSESLATGGAMNISAPTMLYEHGPEVLSFVKSIISNPMEAVGDVWEAAKKGFQELVNPGERLTFRDILKSAAPVYTTLNPAQTEIIGFGMDLIADPINYVSFGTGGLFKESAKILGKTGKIISLSDDGVKIFGKSARIAEEAGVTGYRARKTAEEAIQEILDPGVKSVRDIVNDISLEVRQKSNSRLNLESQIAEHIDKGTLGNANVVRIADTSYVSQLIKKGELPENLVLKEKKALDTKVFEEASEGYKYGFDDNALRSLNEGHKFFVIDKKGRISPIVEGVIPNKNSTKFFMDVDGKITFLDKSPSGVQPKNIARFKEAAFDLRLNKRNLLTPKEKYGNLVETTPLVGTLDSIAGEAGEKAIPIGVVYPGGNRIKHLVNDGKTALLDTANISPAELRFMVPGDPRLLTLGDAKKYLANEGAQLRVVSEAKQAIKKELSSITDVKKLVDQGGFKYFGKTIVSSEQFSKFWNTLGGSKVVQAFDDLPGVEYLKDEGLKLANKFGLTSVLEKHFPEWMVMRQRLDGDKHQAFRDAEIAFHKMFTVKDSKLKVSRVLSEKERTEIAEVMSKAQAAVKLEAEKRGLEAPTFELGQSIFKDVLHASNLNVDQRAIAARLSQVYSDFGKIENRIGLLQSNIVNYTPARYEVIRSKEGYSKYRQYRLNKGITSKFTPGEVRTFENAAEAEAAGFRPIEDAGKLYLLRYMEHRQALRQAEWKKFIDVTYGKGNEIPTPVSLDLMRLGETFAPKGFGDEPRILMDLFDGITSTFKKSATVVRPAFAVKQIPSNFIQMYAAMGVDAFKIFDPTTFGDALSFVIRGESKFGISDTFGIKYTPKEVNDLVKTFAVRKHTTIEGIGAPHLSGFIRDLTSDLHTQRAVRELNTPKAVFDGMVDLVGRGARYLEIPAYLEDVMRVGAFISGIKAGHSPESAVRLVDKALFNYTSELTGAEQKIKRFVLPFLTFQKFATELLTKTITQKPGRAINISKIGQGFLSTWNKIAGGETLSDAERNVLPGYLFEQPHVLEQKDDNGNAVFRTFNSIVFLDVLNFLQFDSKNEFDAKETLMKGVLAQLAPYLKIPLETAILEREAFTGKALKGVNAGGIGNIDEDAFLRNMGMMLGFQGGATTAAMGRGLGSAFSQSEIASNLFKKMVSWEEGVNPTTGKRQVYINPYMLLTATTLFPSLREAIKLSQNDRNFWDNTLSFAFGINTIKRNIGLDAEAKSRTLEYEYKSKLKEVEKYMQNGRQHEMEDALEDLREIYDENSRELMEIRSAISSGEIKRYIRPRNVLKRVPINDFRQNRKPVER